MSFNFDELDGAEQQTEYPETFDLSEKGAEIVGRIVGRRDDVGKYGKTVLEVEDDEQVWTVWLSAAMKFQVDDMELTTGDIVGFRNTGDTYTNDHGTFPKHEVRGKKAGN